MRFSNAAEDLEGAPSVYGLTVHMLSKGDKFDLNTRKPAKQA
jgi:hypothetical protein